MEKKSLKRDGNPSKKASKSSKRGSNPSKNAIFIMGAVGILLSLVGLLIFRLLFWLGALLLVLAFVLAILYVLDSLREVEARVEKLEKLLGEDKDEELEDEEEE